MSMRVFTAFVAPTAKRHTAWEVGLPPDGEAPLSDTYES